MKEALRVLIEFGKTKANLATHFFTSIYTFFLGLVAIEMARTTKRSGKHRAVAQKAIKTIKSWVKIGNANLAHKLLLLKADFNALQENHEKKVRMDYDAAIVAASRAGFIQDAALANERAGLWFSSRNDENSQYWAKVYIERAHLLYSDWSAHGKARHMMRTYPQILNKDASSSLGKTIGESVSQITGYSGQDRSGAMGAAVTSSGSFTPEARLTQTSTTFRGVTRFDPEAAGQHSRVAERSSFFTANAGNTSLRKTVWQRN